MHKQMTVLKNSRILFATMLFLLVSVLFAIIGVCGFGGQAVADESEPTDEPETPTITIDEQGNRIFAGDTQNEFSVDPSWVYGTVPNVATPRAEYIGVGDDAGVMNITLHLNGELIATEIEPYNLANYVNKCMPAGDYSLVLTSPNVTIDDTFYGSKTYSFDFTVERAPMPEKYINTVVAALTTGEPNEYIYDGTPKFYSEDIHFDFIDNGSAEYDRGAGSSVYWSSEAADEYFGGIELVVNVANTSVDHYHTCDYYRAYYADKDGVDFDCEPTVPCEPGRYTVYYMLTADNYLDSVDTSSVDRLGYYFDVTVFGEVDVPTVPSVAYNGEIQKGILGEDWYESPHFSVVAFNGWDNVGTYNITLSLLNPEYYLWRGQTLETRSQEIRVPFTIEKASNDWVQLPDVVRWVEGEYNAEDNAIIGEAMFGNVEFVITDADDNIVFSSVDGINKLADLKAGSYNFSATVSGSDNYNVLSYSKFIRVLEKQGLPWWGTLCITLGALLLVAIIILILYKKGVFRLLTDKIVLAIRTKATVDATIAAVRANKVAEQSKASREQAEARDRAEEQAAARKQAAQEARNKPQEEKFAALEAKAKATADRAEAMRLKAEAMQARLDEMKAKASAKTSAQPDNGVSETAIQETAVDAENNTENTED